MGTDPFVYTITVIDIYRDKTVGIRRTPAIYMNLQDAWECVRNNFHDLADNNSYQYAVIERTVLNVVRPQVEHQLLRWSFKYNSVTDEFEPAELPVWLRNQSGFGIG